MGLQNVLFGRGQNAGFALRYRFIAGRRWVNRLRTLFFEKVQRRKLFVNFFVRQFRRRERPCGRARHSVRAFSARNQTRRARSDAPYRCLLRLAIFSLAVATTLNPGSILACAACYGQSDSAMDRGMNWGIFTLLAVVVSVLTAIASAFILVARRASPPSAPSSRPKQSQTLPTTDL